MKARKQIRGVGAAETSAQAGTMAKPWASSAAGRAGLAALVVMAALIGAAGCRRTETEAKEDGGKGPHGGKLLKKADFALEVKIFEEGVPPEYRLYAFEDDKPLPATDFNATITLKRLERTDTINFSPSGDYRIGDKEIVEPH